MSRAFIAFLLGLVLGAYAQNPSASLPPHDGVYLRTTTGWQPLDRTASEVRAHEHVARALIFPNMVELALAFDGDRARFSTPDRQPSLMVQGAFPDEVHVVRLDAHKDRRLLPIAHGTVFHYAHAVPVDRVAAFDESAVAGTTRVLHAKASLTPGQYIVIFGPTHFGRWNDPRAHYLQGYDFEVR